MDPSKASDLQAELAQTRRELEKLKTETLLQRDEIRALKAEARSFQDEIQSLNSRVQTLEERTLHSTPALTIGREVRLRYLERHRQRMGRPIGALGHARVKSGDRAAHRGRPVVDALLCLSGLVTDRDVYADLYGVSPEKMREWKDVSEIVEITGFRASLRSEGRLGREFEAPFERLRDVATGYASEGELRAAFEENRTLQLLQGELQDCYDRIVAANSRGQQDSSSRRSS